MAEAGKHEPLIFRCPYCFARGNDSVYLEHDEVTNEYYCPRCVFEGDEAALIEAYNDYKKRYKFITTRLNLLIW